MALVEAHKQTSDVGQYYRYTLAAGDGMYVQMAGGGENWQVRSSAADSWYLAWQVRAGAGATVSVKYLFQPDFTIDPDRWVEHDVHPEVGSGEVQGYAHDVLVGGLHFSVAGGPAEVEIIAKRKLKIHDGS